MDLDGVKKEIGEAIAAAREKLGKSFDDIFQETKINPEYLKKIEEGQFDFLPRPYVVAYLKTFANKVKLDGQALVNQWLEAEQAHLQTLQEEAGEVGTPVESAAELVPELKRPKPASAMSRYTREILGGVGLVVGVLLLLYYFSQNGKSPEPVESTGELTANHEQVNEIPIEEMVAESEKRVQQKLIPTVPEETPTAPKSQAVRPAPLLLKAEAIENVWMKVIIDGIDESEYTFQPGNRYQWDGEHEFRLIIGNAGGIRLYLNGRDLGVIGKSGQVARLTIDKSGIVHKRLSHPRPVADTTGVRNNMQANADTLRH